VAVALRLFGEEARCQRQRLGVARARAGEEFRGDGAARFREVGRPRLEQLGAAVELED
jgi:hypothetical protein